MKRVFLKLEQTKKSKNGNSLVSLKTKSFDVASNESAVETCTKFVREIANSLNLAREMGAKAVKVGGVNFSFSGKFVLYVNIDGCDYSLDDVATIWDGSNKTENSFKNGGAFFVAMYQILRTADGKSALLTADGRKESIKLLSI